MKSKEEKVQESMISVIENSGLIPYSVFYTKIIGDKDTGLLCITMYSLSDLYSLLKLFGYQEKCDKSGFTVIKESSTVMLTGIALTSL
jgi:hypothetical protein